MKQVKRMVLLFLGLLSLFSSSLMAQGCPPPENLHIRIDGSTQPPTAHVNWTAPSGGNVVGFILTYSIDGAPPISINLPLAPTAYDVVLPENWNQLEVELVSVCADGSTSDISRTKVTNIIIVDLVLASQGGAERVVCTNPCPGSTHFFYRQGYAGDVPGETGGTGTVGLGSPNAPDDPSSFEVFRNATFCFCMNRNGNDYQNQPIVDACRLSAREFLSPEFYYLTICQSTGDREQSEGTVPSLRKGVVKWYPNPVSEELLIQASSESVHCEITDMAGKYMAEPFDLHTSAAVQVSEWKQGVYFIRTTDQNGSISVGKFVKI